MAANYIELDRQSDIGRQIIRGLQMVREGREALVYARDVMIQMRDGDGTLAAHYDVLATEAGYQANDYADANTAARESFLEVDSLLSKINTNNAVTDVQAAINQACAKHGI